MSVCIATARRPGLLAACLDSLVAQRMHPSFEVLVGTDPDPELASLVGSYDLDCALVEVAAIDGRPLAPADKRNLLITRARGELLLFLDDDVVVHPDFLAYLLEDAGQHPDVAVFGGPNLTPPGSSRFQVIHGAVLGSLVGAGPTRRRWGAHPAGMAREPYFTLCNLAVRASTMVPFPPGLYTGEECAVLNQLRRQGLGMWYDPRLAVFHERRPSLATFARQVFGYGRGRGRVVRRSVENFRPSFLAPIAFLVYLAMLPLLTTVTTLAPAPLGIYALLVAAQAVQIQWSLDQMRWVAPEAMFLIVCVHVCYGVGSIAGVFMRHEVRVSGPPVWVDLAQA